MLQCSQHFRVGVLLEGVEVHAEGTGEKNGILEAKYGIIDETITFGMYFNTYTVSIISFN